MKHGLIDIFMAWNHTCFSIRRHDIVVPRSIDTKSHRNVRPQFLRQTLGGFERVQETLLGLGLGSTDYTYQVTPSVRPCVVGRTYGIEFDAISLHPNIRLEINMNDWKHMDEIRITCLPDSPMKMWFILGNKDGDTVMQTVAPTIKSCYKWLSSKNMLADNIGIWLDGVLITRLSTDDDWAMAILRWPPIC